MYTPSFFLLISLFSGWYFEHLELPKQGRTKIPKNHNYEPHIVRDKLGFAVYTLLTTSLSSCIIIIVGTLINMAQLSWRNKVKKRPEVRAKMLQKYVSAEKDTADDGGSRAWIELGDRHPDFVYTI